MEAYKTAAGFMDEEEESLLLFYLCLLGSFFYIIWLGRDRTNYARIPSASFTGTLPSFFSALRHLYNAPGMLQDGYSKFSNGIFRFPTLTRWIVVVARPKYIEELRKAPEDDLSASEAIQEILQLPFTIDSSLFTASQLKSLLGAQLTRNLHQLLPEMRAEMVAVVDDLISSEANEWKYCDEIELMTSICNRIINRALVGTSLCRNPEFTDLTVTAVNELEKHARRLSYFPTPLRWFAAFLFTPFIKTKKQLRSLLSDTLKERQERLVKHGDPFPNDMITWIVNHDPNTEMSLDELAAHVLLVNYLAVHPTAKVMSQALRNLARYPEFTERIRTEIERAVRREGWCKAALEKMHGLDGFLKETMRIGEGTYNAFYPQLTMARKSLRPFTFSDGTTIPTNTLLFVGSQLLHMDARYHAPAPRMFNPFRFASSNPDSGAEPPMPLTPLRVSPSTSTSTSPSSPSSSSALQPPSPLNSSRIASLATPVTVPVSSSLPATSPTFLAWGHGKHACPGRFFASAVMKLLLAHFILGFEFRVPPLPGSGPESDSVSSGDSQTGREAYDGSGKGGKSQKVLWIEVRRRKGKGSDLARGLS